MLNPKQYININPPEVHGTVWRERLRNVRKCRQEGVLSNAVFWYDMVTALIKSQWFIYILGVGIPSVCGLYWLMNKKTALA